MELNKNLKEDNYINARLCLYMNFCDEKITVGIVGVGSLVNLLIAKLSIAEVSINLLENEINEQLSTVNIRYHASLATLSRVSTVIITVLSDGPALENTLFGNDGIVNFSSVGSVIVDMSSVSPELIQEISEQLIEKEISFLDAAIINEEKIESGVVQMMLIGGDEYVYERVRPLFQRIAKNVRYIGAHGASQFYRQAFAVRAKKTHS